MKSKTASCYVTGPLLFIDIHRGKEVMKKSKYHMEPGATEACMDRTMEATRGLDQRNLKGATKYFSF